MGSNRTSDEVKTLFVGGLPMDTKPRELYLLFRGYKGYEKSLLYMSLKIGKIYSPVVFVTFLNRENAETAQKELDGIRFDENFPHKIHVEFAKKNSTNN